MSNALAIAAVTAVIKDLLDNAIVDASLNAALGTNVTVKSVPPDLVKTDESTGPVLNLYLYRVTPNLGWRNAGQPSRNGAGARIANAPLALDLHYLLSAYGTQDLESEILLGYAMQQLHERPLLTRDAIRTSLAAPSPVDASILPPAFAALAAADLAEQVELVKLTPAAMSTEELSKLWGAFQSSYRPTAAYLASVVLIQSTHPLRSGPPVLTIGAAARGPTVAVGLKPPIPTLERVTAPDKKPAVNLGDTVELSGHHLAGDPMTEHTIELRHPRLSEPVKIVADPTKVSDAAIEFGMNTAAGDTPAGVYAVTVSLTRDGKSLSTNALPLVLAPRIDHFVTGTIDSTHEFTLTVTPDVLPKQSASLLVGSNGALAKPHSAATATLEFEFNGLAPGTYPLRLRIDGIDSVLIDYAASPPVYLESQRVTL